MSITPVITHIGKYVDPIRYFLESELSPLRDVPIVLDNPIEFHKHLPTYPPKFIFYNPEQCSRPFIVQTLLYIHRTVPSITEIWDYSAKNVEILKRYGINARHVPFQSPDAYTSLLQKYRSEEAVRYDVGFSGALSERRTKILQELQSRSVSVMMDGASFGEPRDRNLAKCRVIINIHYADDYHIFESVRCEPWIAIGVPVISEESWDNDSRAINVPYDHLVERTIELLQQTP